MFGLLSTSSLAASVPVAGMFRSTLATVVVVSTIVLGIQTPVVKASCPVHCVCRWKGGKETTECVDNGLTAMPAGIDVGTQVLDMTGNNLQSLPKEVFVRSGLLNIQRLHLARCNLGSVDRHAFSRLANLVELDLSQNRLAAIPTDSFVNIPELRRLVLSGNLVTRIESKAFANLKSLVSLELTNCIIETIEDHAFDGLTSLQQLKLNGNRLQTLSMGVLSDLASLSNILLAENPWTCDCAAKDFRQWLLVSQVPYYISPQCNLPLRLKGFDMYKLTMEDFACAPTGSTPYQLVQVQQGSNVTLECKVTADPEPFIHWLFQDTVITNGTEPSSTSSEYMDGKLYWVDESGSGGNDKVSALFLGSVEERDAGHYVCVAENRGGRYLVNFTLEVTRQPVKTHEVPLVVNHGFFVGLTVGVSAFALLVVALVCLLLIKYCCSRKKRIQRHKLPRSETQETKGSSTYDSPNECPLNDKCNMLQPTNPIQKPPRSFSNTTYVSTSPISLHDYSIQENGGVSAELIELSKEPKSGSFISIKPDIIKVDNLGEYSVPRSQQLNGNAIRQSMTGNGISNQQNAGRWNTESPIATCNTCGDHTTSCLGVPCLNSSYGGEVDTESDHSYRANVRPMAFGPWRTDCPPGYDSKEWPRPPPPLYDTVKHPIPVSSVWTTQHTMPQKIDEHYELVDYDNVPMSSAVRPVWERQSPTTAANAAAAAMDASSSSCYPSMSCEFPQNGDEMARSSNVHLKDSVPGLSPFPLLNLSTVRDSPDEGYEDEGDEGTEV